ncbi:MAG: N-acetylmuramoyl-L-alanine amidase [Synechococcales cyanobacterium C42_A2020_086]|jgi:N-acetylmuramoyl-L-alanine amidase|nr:N-acetylmuramoyl-L-alanine amidase [Synechococcales cyanobacterium C42_A2020_086]
MKQGNWLGLGGIVMGTLGMTNVAWAEQPLSVVYPPDGHETTAAQIFLIGTAPVPGEVTVNGEPIQRSAAGHFAPSVPLQLGENVFTLRYQDQELMLRITRVTATPPVPVGTAFAEGSLTPAVDIARLPQEPICFSAIAPPQATVSVTLANQTIPLLPQGDAVELPPNSAVLTLQNQPIVVTAAQSYQGCVSGERWSQQFNPATDNAMHDLGYPEFRLSLHGQTVSQTGPGRIVLMAPVPLPVVEVTAESGTARSGPSTDYSRLTPLPQGTRAAITGREGEWLRLDYGGWIRASDTQPLPNAAPPQTLIRSIRAHTTNDWTEIRFPLQVPVPVSVQQGNRSFTLTLHNTTAQTDTILLNDDPVIERLDWQQSAPGQVQYTFHLKSPQQWGYTLRYEGTTLVLSLRHPPELSRHSRQPLAGIRILIDPGHGGPEDLGARGPTGYPEKEVALIVSRLLRDRLEARGATVYMTRDDDIDLWPQDRAAMINEIQPTLALSVHYNALPDDGDAVNTAGIGTFWYNAQSHSLAVFLHNYLVETLNRPSYGVFWNNLALTRPTVAPAVLLELGFMINPEEFEWIVDPRSQEQLADALADGVVQWVQRAAQRSP